MSAALKLIQELEKNVKTSQVKVSPLYTKLVDFFPLFTITSKKQHESALKIINSLISHTSVGPKDKGVDMYLNTLVGLTEDYEKSKYKFSSSSGADILAHIMKLQGLTQADLSKELGGQSIVSEILKGKRELNLRQVKALSGRFKVSPSIFI